MDSYLLETEAGSSCTTFQDSPDIRGVRCTDSAFVSITSIPSEVPDYEGFHNLLDVSLQVLLPLYVFLLGCGVIRAIFYRL